MVSSKILARGLAAFVSLALGIIAASGSLALALAKRQPALALRLDPGNAEALASASLDRMRADLSDTAIAQSKSQARGALAGNGAEVDALIALAITRQIAGDIEGAASLMNYAESRTRRDLPVLLWWIEYWANRGDVGRTLSYYDTALRTSRAAPGTLFPTLIKAAGNARVEEQLVPILAQRPPWSAQFLQQMAQSETDHRAIARLFGDLARHGAPVDDQALSTAIERIASAGSYDAAWNLFRAYRPEALGDVLRNANFADRPTSPTLFEWQLSEGDLSATLDNGLLDLSAASGASGVVAHQVIVLAPGRHSIRAAINTGSAMDATPGLALRCLSAGTLLGQTSAMRGGSLTLAVQVPLGCGFQSLELTLDNSGGSRRASAAFNSVEIAR